jgi:hypothetical protein
MGRKDRKFSSSIKRSLVIWNGKKESIWGSPLLEVSRNQLGTEFIVRRDKSYIISILLRVGNEK